MIKEIHFHKRITGVQLDEYLQKGWYRIGQLVFTTDHIPHPEGSYRVFWLRYRLSDFRFGKSQEKIIKLNKDHTLNINPFEITGELNKLYQQYYDSIDFEASPTLQNSLYDYGILDDPFHNVYDSQVIEIRRRGQLIAAGVFDLGEKAMAGILNFFDPLYKKYSLGKWLMILKIRHAIESGMEYYYPGYIALGFAKFDYKLFAGEDYAEIYDPVNGAWLNYEKGIMEKLNEQSPGTLPEINK